MSTKRNTKTESKIISRRSFMKGTALSAASFMIVPRHVIGGLGFTAPSDKLNIAGIGVGGQGKANLKALEDENIVALCDVDFVYASETAERYPKAKQYADYRVMLENQKDIDAVVIATPDHTHAVISMAAIQAGKHVYCQKPLTHHIYESRMLSEAAKKSGVTTAMGIQGHSGEGIRLICEWIWDGAIGEVMEVDAWCSLSYYPWGHESWSTKWDNRPVDTPGKPDHIDWDLWIGPAQYRPYHPAYHPRVWRAWWDFGNGMMGDRGVHTLDAVFKALKLGYASNAYASILGGNDETHPLASNVTFNFPARENYPPLKLNWFEGLEAPRPSSLEVGRRLPEEGGMIFKGTKGTIMGGVYGESPRLIPESSMKAYGGTEKKIARIDMRHEQDWAKHCKAGTKPGASFEYSGPLTELAQLGNIAKRFPGNSLTWDGPNMKVTNLPEADEWIKRPYREGWYL